jgi:Uncharacterized conserved protein
MLKTDKRILEQIVAEIAVADSLLCEVSYEVFESSEEKKRAVAMTVINVGELAKHLSEEFFKSYSMLELKYAARTRDIYAHGYATLSFPMVYKTATTSFTELRDNILNLLNSEDR